MLLWPFDNRCSNEGFTVPPLGHEVHAINRVTSGRTWIASFGTGQIGLLDGIHSRLGLHAGGDVN